MTVFIDTSAFYAVLDRDDSNHSRAAEVWRGLLRKGTTLFTSNYVLLETAALVQHRLCIAALRAFHEDVAPLLTVHWVTEEEHQGGMEAALAAARKRLSLVDCVSFRLLREAAVRSVFCFDQHFREQGFETVTAAGDS